MSSSDAPTPQRSRSPLSRHGTTHASSPYASQGLSGGPSAINSQQTHSFDGPPGAVGDGPSGRFLANGTSSLSSRQLCAPMPRLPHRFAGGQLSSVGHTLQAPSLFPNRCTHLSNMKPEVHAAGGNCFRLNTTAARDCIAADGGYALEDCVVLKDVNGGYCM